MSDLICAMCAAVLPPNSEGVLCDRPRCRWLYDQTPWSRLCPECRWPDCGPTCQHPHVRDHLQARAKQRAILEAQCLNARDTAAETLSIPDPQRYPLLIVPSFTAELVPVSPQRKESLARRLSEAFAQAIAERVDPPPPIPLVTTPILGHACTLCRGHCCATGGDHAYINAGTAARVLSEQPDRHSRDLQSDYLAAVPDQALAGSCLYHGRQGCALPAHLRSNTCHTYFCPPLRSFLFRSPTRDSAQAFLVSVDEDIRAAFANEDSSLTVDVRHLGHIMPSCDKEPHPLRADSAPNRG